MTVDGITPGLFGGKNEREKDYWGNNHNIMCPGKGLIAVTYK